jgi:TonB-linked SusC/RagA family outer membrane protein
MKKVFIVLVFVLVSAGLNAQDTTRLDLGYDRFVTKDVLSSAVAGVTYQDFKNSSQKQILNSLYGMIPGLELFQSGSGARPDDTYPGIVVRGRGSYSGNHVLVLVDGVPRDASYIDVHEVESVTVLKDAASLAIYGVRGADGAVLVTTKRGGDHTFNISAGYSFGLQQLTRLPEMASPVQYANALNEARANDGLPPYFSASNVASIADGTNKVIPIVDWRDQILRNYGFDNDVHLMLDGSAKLAKFFVYADYRGNRGFFNNTRLLEGLDCQNNYDGLKVRSNLDIVITPTTNVLVNLAARIQQNSGPYNGTSLYAMYTAPTVGFPIMYDDIWARSIRIENPVRSILGSGTNTTFSRMLSADFTIRQDLVSLLKGLSAEARLAYDNSADILDRKTFGSEYYIFSPLYDEAGNLTDYALNKYGNATEMSFSSYLSHQFMQMSVWGKLGWNGTIGNYHHLNAAFIFNRDKRTNTGANTSFIHHDYVLTCNYDYDKRYLASVTLDYSGSSYMPRGDKFRPYFAASLGWVVSNEDFLKNARALDLLKIRGSYGRVGMDRNLSYDMDIQFNGGGRSFMFVTPNYAGGASEGALPSTGIEPELDTKTDIGLEFQLFKGLTGEIDLFRNTRKNLRTSASNTISSVIGIGLGDAFNGKTENQGIDVALGWRQKAGEFSYYIRGTATYAKNRILAYDQAYQPEPYLYLQGNSIGRFYGLVSDGFYQESDFDASGNLLPDAIFSTFAAVQPGDVKYKDLNADGIIDNYDYTYQLKSPIPELYYGLQLGLGWKGIGFNLKFQGVSGRTMRTALGSIYQPLFGGDKNISRHYLENHWTKENPDARYPRLTTLENKNNYLSSDLWTEDGSFFKLREAEVYYNLPEKLANSLTFKEVRIFARGDNVFSVDSIGILDPEAINYTYPLARTWTLGLNVTF